MMRPGPDTLCAYDAEKRAVFFAGGMPYPVGFTLDMLRKLGWHVQEDTLARTLPRLDKGSPVIQATPAEQAQIRSMLGITSAPPRRRG